MAGVIQMSDRELTRLRVMIDLADDRLTVDAAATLLGLGRRQIYRLRRIFSADGPAGLASRKRGRPSNRKRGETFRATVLSLVREHYIDFGPTLAAEKLIACHGLRIGVETLRQWMMAERLWIDRRHKLPSPHQPRRRRECLGLRRRQIRNPALPPSPRPPRQCRSAPRPAATASPWLRPNPASRRLATAVYPV
jgi:Helix-turn-helix domain